MMSQNRKLIDKDTRQPQKACLRLSLLRLQPSSQDPHEPSIDACQPHLSAASSLQSSTRSTTTMHPLQKHVTGPEPEIRAFSPLRQHGFSSNCQNTLEVLGEYTKLFAAWHEPASATAGSSTVSSRLLYPDNQGHCTASSPIPSLSPSCPCNSSGMRQRWFSPVLYAPTFVSCTQFLAAQVSSLLLRLTRYFGFFYSSGKTKSKMLAVRGNDSSFAPFCVSPVFVHRSQSHHPSLLAILWYRYPEPMQSAPRKRI